MKFTNSNCRRRAFTLVEVLVLVAVIVMVVFVLLPPANDEKRPVNMVICVDNLKQIGSSFRVWEGDHGNRYPMNVAVSSGGAQELMTNGQAAACFQMLSNSLDTPKIFLCPADANRTFATNFTSLSRSNISYFIALNAAETDPQAFLSGDDNLLVRGQPVSPGVLNLDTNSVTWASNRHHNRGLVLLGDGSVQSATQYGLKSYMQNATNSVVIP